MYECELDHKEDWAPKNWCFQTVVLEKTLDSFLDSKEIKPVSPKGNQPWIFIGRTDAEAEAWILWSTGVKSRLTREPLDVGKDWQEEKGMRMRSLDGITDSMDMIWTNFEREWRTGKPGVLQSMGLQSQTRLSNWIITWKTLFKTSNLGTSLAVQGLRFHASTAGAWVSSLVGEIRTHKPQEENKPKTSNLWQIFHSTLYFFWT